MSACLLAAETYGIGVVGIAISTNRCAKKWASRVSYSLVVTGNRCAEYRAVMYYV
jgi:hypothetical protein